MSGTKTSLYPGRKKAKTQHTCNFQKSEYNLRITAVVQFVFGGGSCWCAWECPLSLRDIPPNPPVLRKRWTRFTMYDAGQPAV